MQFTMKATATGILTKHAITVRLMTWAGAGAAGDSLVVVDNSGKDIWRAVAPQTNYDLSFGVGERASEVNGINVTSLGSGTLTVYYR